MISLLNLITGPILVQMISYFDSWRNISKFYVYCVFFFFLFRYRNAVFLRSRKLSLVSRRDVWPVDNAMCCKVGSDGGKCITSWNWNSALRFPISTGLIILSYAQIRLGKICIDFSSSYGLINRTCMSKNPY